MQIDKVNDKAWDRRYDFIELLQFDVYKGKYLGCSQNKYLKDWITISTTSCSDGERYGFGKYKVEIAEKIKFDFLFCWPCNSA